MNLSQMRILTIVVLIFFTIQGVGQSPESDCSNAVPVCNNAGSNGIVNGFGNDDFNGASSTGCLSQGSDSGATVESNSAWYTFTMTESGQFGFDINPVNSSEDWDFALYGPFTESTGNCDQVATMEPIRGSYALNTGPTGVGISGGEDCAFATGSAYVNWLDVMPGETYVLFINNYTNTNSGFTLTFTGDIFSNSSGSNPLDCSLIETIDYCIGDFITLDATVPNANSYIWTDDNGVTLSETGAVLSGILASNTTYNAKAYNTSGDLIGESNFIVAVNDNDAGTDGTIDFCSNDPPTDLFTVLGGTPEIGGTWSPALSSGTGVFNPQTDTGGIYTYTVDDGVCPPSTAQVDVVFDAFSISITDGDQNFCVGDPDYTLNVAAVLGGSNTIVSYNWFITDPSNSLGNTNSLVVNTTGNYSVEVVDSNGCRLTESVQINYNTIPNAGLDEAISLCSNDGGVDLFLVLGGTPDPGGVWSPALDSGTGLFDPLIDISGVYTYTVSGNGCLDQSAQISVTVNELGNAGEGGTVNLCVSDPAIDLFTSLLGNPEIGGVWSPSLNSGSGVFDPSIDPAGIYVYTIFGAGSCPDVFTTVEVVIDQLANPGMDASIELCTDDNAVDLFSLLGAGADPGGSWLPSLVSSTGVFDPMTDAPGAYTYSVSNGSCSSSTAIVTVNLTQAANSGIDTNYSICSNSPPVDLYSVLEGNADAGGTWFPSLTSGTGVFDPGLDPSGVYTYTVNGLGPCSDSSSTVTVSIDSEPDAGVGNAFDLCTTDSSFDLFTLLGGTPETGGIWSPALQSGSGIFNPAIDAGGIYTYTVSNGVCMEATALVNLTLSIAPNAGSDGSIILCTGDQAVDLFDQLGSNPDTQGVWSPSLNSGTGLFDPAIDNSGLYTYTVVGDGTCENSTASVQVQVGRTPNTGSNGSAFYCISDGPSDLFDLLSGNPETGGTWSPSLASGTGMFDPEQDLAGVYTYTIVGELGCENSSTVSIELSEAAVITEIVTDDFSENNTITVFVEGAYTGTAFGIGDYEYAYDLVGFQDSNIFENVPAGNYTMIVRDKKGCLPDAEMDFAVVGAPNFFTPNDDGVNDFWQVINLQRSDLVNPSEGISIFDRFGKLVANIMPESDGWDGFYNGVQLPETDYWYSVEVFDAENNPVQKRGHFSLIRR